MRYLSAYGDAHGSADVPERDTTKTKTLQSHTDLFLVRRSLPKNLSAEYLKCIHVLYTTRSDGLRPGPESKFFYTRLREASQADVTALLIDLEWLRDGGSAKRRAGIRGFQA